LNQIPEEVVFCKYALSGNNSFQAMIELPVISKAETRKRKPDWLRVKLPVGPDYARVRRLVDNYKLHTICESGNCPNMGECWGAGTATRSEERRVGKEGNARVAMD